MVERSHTSLLRCWQEPDGDGKPTWRFTLTHIDRRRERKGFACLEAVFAYLQGFLALIDRHISGGKQP